MMLLRLITLALRAQAPPAHGADHGRASCSAWPCSSGMHTANQSVLFAFYKTIDRIAGKAELQVTAGEGGFPEEVLERCRPCRRCGSRCRSSRRRSTRT